MSAFSSPLSPQPGDLPSCPHRRRSTLSGARSPGRGTGTPGGARGRPEVGVATSGVWHFAAVLRRTTGPRLGSHRSSDSNLTQLLTGFVDFRQFGLLGLSSSICRVGAADCSFKNVARIKRKSVREVSGADLGRQRPPSRPAPFIPSPNTGRTPVQPVVRVSPPACLSLSSSLLALCVISESCHLCSQFSCISLSSRVLQLSPFAYPINIYQTANIYSAAGHTRGAEVTRACPQPT